MDTKMIHKKSQVTIFVILAILLVAGIILVIFLKGRQVIEVFKPSMPNIQGYIESCTKDATKQAIDIMLLQGGYITPENYKMYKDNKVQYLCYQKNYYKTCVNQQPLYTEYLEKEIKKYIEGKIEDCFYSFKQEYEKKGYQISLSGKGLKVELAPKQARIEIEKEVSIKRNEEARNYDKFKIIVLSPIYDLAVIAQEIINQEAKFCYFEYLGFSLLYPEYAIEKIDIDGETKIYLIEEKSSGKTLVFAVRSCAMPGGI